MNVFRFETTYETSNQNEADRIDEIISDASYENQLTSAVSEQLIEFESAVVTGVSTQVQTAPGNSF